MKECVEATEKTHTSAKDYTHLSVKDDDVTKLNNFIYLSHWKLFPPPLGDLKKDTNEKKRMVHFSIYPSLN